MPMAWKATTRFGLGSIPITHYPAFEHEKDAFVPLEMDGPAILLHVKRFLEELEDLELLKFHAEDVSVGRKELGLARQLTASLKGPFEPEEFQDSRRARLEQAIRDKVEEDKGKAADAGRGCKAAHARPDNAHGGLRYRKRKAG